MRRILSLTFVAVAAALASSESARAAERVIVALDYEASPLLRGCPDAPQLEAMIAAPLGYAPFRPDAPRQVIVRVRPGERGIEASIEWRDHLGRAPGVRRFATAASDCAAIAKTLAFAVTVQLQMLASDEEAAARESDNPPNTDSPAARPDEQPKPEDAKPSTETPVAPAAIQAAPAVTTTAPVPEGVTVALGTGISAALGLTPGETLGARLFVSARRRQLAIELDLQGTWPSTTTMAAGSNFSHYALATTVGGCYEPEWFSACVLAQAARLTIRGVGVDTPTTSSGWAFAAGLRVAATKRLGERFFVRGRAEALAALTDWTVTLNHEAVWTRPRIAASAGIDVGVRFR